jgi:hypothetical protein
MRDLRLPARVAQGIAPRPNRDAVAPKHPRIAGAPLDISVNTDQLGSVPDSEPEIVFDG